CTPLQETNFISTYYITLKALRDELSSYHSLPNCTCTGTLTLTNFFDKDYFMDFLQRLNESYASVRSQLLLMDPLPSANKAYSLLLQEERQRSLIDFKHQQPDHAAMSTHTAPNSSKSSHHANSSNTSPKYHCSHCNVDDHLDSHCFMLHGYPPNRGGSSSNRGGSSSNRGGRSFNNGSHRPNSQFVAATSLTDNTSSPFTSEQI
ncbi:hypothetical protein CFOL_v3_14975, partial [Cephalotus follicularis]